mgnify:CR=1 FL=1
MNEVNKAIASFTRQRISSVYLSKEVLAKLRRGVGKKLGEIPELLEFVLPADSIVKSPQQETAAEKAIYTALTLYAFHQQGHEDCVNKDVEKSGYNSSFGHAVRNLIENDKTREIAITRRFNTVLTAKDMTEWAVHARGLIGLFKNANISLDYSKLAVELYWFQQDEYRRNVILQWGRDYYMKRKDD